MEVEEIKQAADEWHLDDPWALSGTDDPFLDEDWDKWIGEVDAPEWWLNQDTKEGDNDIPF